MIYTKIQGSRPLKGYGLYTSFQSSSRAIGSTNFVAVGRFAAAIQPTDVKMPFFRSSVGTNHLKYAVPTELEYQFLAFSVG